MFYLVLFIDSRVLTGPYFITLYVIFPIHLNFPIRSRKKQWIVLWLLEKVFSFSKDAFYDIVHACGN